MSRRATLRWPDGADWGYVTVHAPTEPTRFAGFVRMTDERVRELIARNPGTTDGEMREVEFDVTEPILATIR